MLVKISRHFFHHLQNVSYILFLTFYIYSLYIYCNSHNYDILPCYKYNYYNLFYRYILIMMTDIHELKYVNSCKGSFTLANKKLTFDNVLHSFMYGHDSDGHVYDNYMNWFMENIMLFDREPSTKIVRGVIDLYSIIYVNENKSKRSNKYEYLKLNLLEEEGKEIEEVKNKSFIGENTFKYAQFRKKKESIKKKYDVKQKELYDYFYGDRKICKITEETFRGNKSRIIYRNFFESIKKTENDDILFFKDDNYVILPKHKKKYAIENLTKIQSIKDETLRLTMLNNLLFDIQFQYYSENLTIYDLINTDKSSREKRIEELEIIKKNIKKFYFDKFRYTVLSDYILYITLNNSHTKTDNEQTEFQREYSNKLVFDFILIDRIGYKYISFIDTITKKTIDDIINGIREDNMYFYGENEMYNQQIDCIPKQPDIDSFRKVQREPIKPESDKFEIIFGKDTQRNKINIITVFNTPNKHHSYCSIFMLVEMGGKYYEMSIKSVTYEIVNLYIKNPANMTMYKPFYETLCQKLNDVLLTKPIYSFSGRTEYGEHIPAVVEIFSNEVNPTEYTISITINYLETAEIYRDVIISKIKSEAEINTSVIMTILWFRSFINMYKTYYAKTLQSIKEVQLEYLLNNEDIKDNPEYSDEERAFANFTYHMLRNPFYGYFILGYIEHTEHFIKVLKYMDKIYYILYLIFNIDDYTLLQNEIDKITSAIDIMKFRITLTGDYTRKSILKRFIEYLNIHINNYVIWFCHEQLIIYDYDKAIEFIKDNIPPKFIDVGTLSDIYKKIDKMRRLNGDRDIFKEFSNFYDIFKEPTFMHTIREWYDCKFKDEIKHLIDNTMFRTGMHNISRDCLNVLHFQYTPIQNDFQSSDKYDMLKRNNNVKSERLKFYVDIKDTTTITDMTVSIVISTEINKFLKLRKNKDKFKEFIFEYVKKEYPIKYYSDEHIMEILQENIEKL